MSVCLRAHLCFTRMPGDHGGQRSVSDALEVESQMIGSHCWMGAGYRTWIFYKNKVLSTTSGSHFMVRGRKYSFWDWIVRQNKSIQELGAESHLTPAIGRQVAYPAVWIQQHRLVELNLDLAVSLCGFGSWLCTLGKVQAWLVLAFLIAEWGWSSPALGAEGWTENA